MTKDHCLFCQLKDNVVENELAYAVFDKYPVSEGHMLIIPKRHSQDFFGCNPEEIHAVFDLIKECKKITDDRYHPGGYNIAANCGELAGQKIHHAHVHLIPRYKGDSFNMGI